MHFCLPWAERHEAGGRADVAFQLFEEDRWKEIKRLRELLGVVADLEAARGCWVGISRPICRRRRRRKGYATRYPQPAGPEVCQGEMGAALKRVIGGCRSRPGF